MVSNTGIVTHIAGQNSLIVDLERTCRRVVVVTGGLFLDLHKCNCGISAPGVSCDHLTVPATVIVDKREVFKRLLVGNDTVGGEDKELCRGNTVGTGGHILKSRVKELCNSARKRVAEDVRGYYRTLTDVYRCVRRGTAVTYEEH